MMKQKATLRRIILLRLRQQSEFSQQKKSRIICRRLFRTPLYKQAKRLLCYAAIDGEVQTRPLLGKALCDGKHLFVPVVTDKTRRQMRIAQVKDLDRDLSHRGHYGILHPPRFPAREISLKKLDLVILPGVAFDAQGHRLGRGGGYFDRFLCRIPRAAARVVLAFEMQRVAWLPTQRHDCPVDVVITEKKIYEHPHRR